MQLPNWTRNLLSRRRRARDKSARRELLEPVRLSLRKLEERRVLDVSAAFMTDLGLLEVDITNTEDIATLTNDNGDIAISDAGNNAIDIDIDGGGPSEAGISISDVRSIVVRGDTAPNQRFTLDTPMVLRDGLQVANSIELASINETITRVDNGGIALDSLEVELGANLEATGLTISFGNVSLTDNVTLTGGDVFFAGTINDDGDGGTGSSLVVNASGVTRFEGEVGGLSPIDSLRTDALGHSEINADITAAGNTITFNDPVVLTNSVSLTDTGTTGIRFNDTVDSEADAQHSLTGTATNGSINFSGDIGNGGAGDQSLGTLTITEAADGVVFGDKAGVAHIRADGDIDIGSSATIGGVGIQLNGGAANLLTVTTNGGNVRWNGATELFTDVNVLTNGGNLTLTSDATVDSQPNAVRKLTVDVGTGSVEFNADIGRMVPLNGLDIVSADNVVFGGADTATPGAAGPVEIVRSTGAIAIDTAERLVFNAGNGNTTLVTTTGDDVLLRAINTELRSSLSVDTGPTGGDIRFTSPIFSGEIDAQQFELNDLLLNAGTGSVFFENSIGRTLPLGRLVVEQADGGVTFGPHSHIFEATNGIDIGAGSNVIGGAGITLSRSFGVNLQTSGSDIRLNGPVVLGQMIGSGSVTLDTGAGGGDVIFTNAASINTVEHDVTLRIGTGDGNIRFNEDIAADGQPIELAVAAGGEIFFGESTTETTDGKGPVETLNLTELRVASGTRTVFTGSATRDATLSTGESTLIRGPVELATDLLIETTTADARIIFAADSTIDSAPGTASVLRVDASGLGSTTFFNADIGGTNPLGHLFITTAGHVAFGGATNDLLMHLNVGGTVNLVRTLNGIDVNAESAGTSPSDDTFGIALNGGDADISLEALNGDVRLNGALRGQSNVRVDTSAGGGDILFTSAATFNSDDGPASSGSDERNSLTLDAGSGSVSLNANLGERQRLSSFMVQRASGGVELGGADNVVGDKGPISLILTDGPIALGSAESISGGIVLNAGNATLAIETSAGDIDINGPVEIRSNVAIDTGAGGGNLNLSAKSTLDSQLGESNNVNVTLDAGNATFGAAVGATNPLGELRFTSANDVTLQASVDAARIAQFMGSGTTRFEGSISTTDPTQVGVALTGTSFVFGGPVTAKGNGGVAITHSGLLDINDAADMQLEGSFREDGGGAVETAANIVTTGDVISFGSPVTLTDGSAADVLFDTTGGGNVTGADITFDSTLDGESDGIEQLTLNTGDAGDVQLSGVIGGVMRVGPLHVVNAHNFTADGAVTATRISQAAGLGTTTFNGAIDTNDATERGVDLNTINVSLNDAIQTTGDGRVELTVTGLLDIADAADMNLSGSFLQDGGGSVRTAANITTSDDDVTFTDAVVAADDLRFDTGTGLGTVRFNSTLDGTNDCQEDLHLATGAGDQEFVGAVGGQVGLGDVVVADAHDVTFASSLRVNSITQTTGTGETRFEGPVTIKGAAGTNLATGTVTLDNAFDSSANDAPLLISVTNDIRISSSVTTGLGTVDLLADDDVSFGSAASVTTNGATITVVADADAVADSGIGGAVTLADGAVLNAGDANIGIFADEDITLGQVVTTGLVALTSNSGAIVDGGDVGGDDIVADQLAFQATTGIGTSNPIDTSVNTLAAKNELGGGVRVENAAGTTLTIGDVGPLSGISAGPQNAPAKLGGDIEIIHVGAINVDAPILNDAGGHTRLRAELAGDLTVNQPVQNRGGNGWIFLISGEDLIVHNSLPEPQAEISVENEGAIRGIANEEVIVDNGETDYVIIRTHSERAISETGLTELSARFSDPTQAINGLPGSELFPDNQNTQFYRDLEVELTTIREEVAPQITNVDPIFSIEAVDQGGSDIDERGRGILKITIGDEFHLERNWHLTVDWGDGNIESYTIPGNPVASLAFFNSGDSPSNIAPDLTITPRIDSGELNPDGTRSPGVYFVHHTYLSNPNADDPAAPIPVSATLRPDARSEGEAVLDLGFPTSGSSIFNGIRFFSNGSQEIIATADAGLTNPGAGVFFFVKVVESVIIPVESRESIDFFVTQTTAANNVSTSAVFEFAVATFEGEASAEYRLFLRVVDDVAAIEGTEEFALSLDRLDDPLGLFRERTFPNGHYRIYLEEIRTGRVRLILECHIYEGRLVPPNFREGAGERQPGGDEGSNVDQVPGAEGTQGENTRNPFIDDAPANNADGEALNNEALNNEALNNEALNNEALNNEALNNGAAADNDEAAGSPEASILLPLAAAALPWRHRVRRAIEANDRPLHRARMRLQKLRRSAAND